LLFRGTYLSQQQSTKKAISSRMMMLKTNKDNFHTIKGSKQQEQRPEQPAPSLPTHLHPEGSIDDYSAALENTPADLMLPTPPPPRQQQSLKNQQHYTPVGQVPIIGMMESSQSTTASMMMMTTSIGGGKKERTTIPPHEPEHKQEFDNVGGLAAQEPKEAMAKDPDAHKNAVDEELTQGVMEVKTISIEEEMAATSTIAATTASTTVADDLAQTTVDETTMISKQVAVAAEEEIMNGEIVDSSEKGLHEHSRPTYDDLPLVERGIDDSPSDELGPLINITTTDVVSLSSTPADTVTISTAHNNRTSTVGAESSNVMNIVEAPEPKTHTQPLADASTVMLDNHSSSPEIMEATNESAPIRTPKNHQAKKSKKEKNKPSPSLTFAKAFGTPSKQPPPTTPRGLTFAQAFGSSPVTTPVSPLVTPASVNGDIVEESPQAMEPIPSTKSSGSSHSALSASKNKKVQTLMSKYMEEVAHEPLPGDAIPIHRRGTDQSLSTNTSQDTPLSAQSIREKIAVTEEELAQLPNIKSVRNKFESSSKGSGAEHVFEFGESFRQKKRFEHLSEKERQREAKVALHGFNESDLYPGKVASGEIDTSSLGNVFTFEMITNASMDLPPDGTCRVDYKEADYTAKVFVVHRTKGMLLLHGKGGEESRRQVPGGIVQENEFLEAAQKSGSGTVQLQIAARDAAARQLYESTGLDIRNTVHRLKPAILRVNPPVDARGVQYLKNEYNHSLYYFLQVSEEDFVTIAELDTPELSGGKLTRPTEDPGDSPLALRLRDTLDGFTFVLDPSDAAKILKENGNSEATSALRMIMKEASEGIRANNDNQNNVNGPDAKATEYSVADSAPDDEKDEAGVTTNTSNNNLIRTVGDKIPAPNSGYGTFHDEAGLNHKCSADTTENVDGVKCCCGWW
jgi:8-oxo-dGTP pyrophosphatase MutT (NUDIX family)